MEAQNTLNCLNNHLVISLFETVKSNNFQVTCKSGLVILGRKVCPALYLEFLRIMIAHKQSPKNQPVSQYATIVISGCRPPEMGLEKSEIIATQKSSIPKIMSSPRNQFNYRDEVQATIYLVEPLQPNMFYLLNCYLSDHIARALYDQQNFVIFSYNQKGKKITVCAINIILSRTIFEILKTLVAPMIQSSI